MSHVVYLLAALVAAVWALPFLVAPLFFVVMAAFGAFRRNCEVEGDARKAGPRPACSGLFCTRVTCKRRQMLAAAATARTALTV